MSVSYMKECYRKSTVEIAPIEERLGRISRAAIAIVEDDFDGGRISDPMAEAVTDAFAQFERMPEPSKGTSKVSRLAQASIDNELAYVSPDAPSYAALVLQEVITGLSVLPEGVIVFDSRGIQAANPEEYYDLDDTITPAG